MLINDHFKKKKFKYLHNSHWAATLGEFIVLFIVVGNPVWHFYEVKAMSSDKAIIKSYAVGFLIKGIVFLCLFFNQENFHTFLIEEFCYNFERKLGHRLFLLKRVWRDWTVFQKVIQWPELAELLLTRE